MNCETHDVPNAQFGSHVLLVEDNAVDRRLATEALEALGCSVDTALSGREAVEKFRDSRYDLVFMDCLIPDTNGYKASELIRELEKQGEHVPIVAMTDHPDIARDRCPTSGMDTFLLKPVKPEEFHDVLKQFHGAPLGK